MRTRALISILYWLAGNSIAPSDDLIAAIAKSIMESPVSKEEDVLGCLFLLNLADAFRGVEIIEEQLQTLCLGWSAFSDPEMQELVLDHLQPHANLKKLRIEGYRGISYPNWSLPFLEKLELENMPAIKKLDYQGQHLKELIIYNMKGLEELSGSGADAGQWHPHLQTLEIRSCPELEVLPSLSLSIKRMHLSYLGLVSLPTLWLDRSSTCSTSDSLSSSSSLEVLKILNCWNIASLDKGLLQLQHYLTALVRLEIRHCPDLVDFPSGGLQHLRALEDLRIEKCPKLQVAPDPITPDGNDDKFLPTSLRTLDIAGCAELMRSMQALLKGIVSLDRLSLRDCEEPMSLEGLMGLQSVGRLDIVGCPELVPAAGLDFTIAVEDLFIDDPIQLVSGIFTPVRKLYVTEWRQLESIDGWLDQWCLKNQTTLKSIWIHEASALESLPGSLKNLSSLECLVIYDASETLKERCRQDEGADWPTISHIPYITIT